MKKTIALVTGGFTGESVVSFKSATFVESKIDRNKYDVFKIVILKDEWYYTDSSEVKHTIDKNDFSLILSGTKIVFDVAFIMIHGAPGEDGKLQGYFDLLNIPYTSCDALTSSLTMNKGYCKAIVNGIKDLHVAKSVQLFDNSSTAIQHLLDSLVLPFFIKPNNGGSSIGMSKVKNANDLPDALIKAFNEDNQVLVEEFIQGREFSIGVYNSFEGIRVLPSTEVIPTNEFFDYEAKYTPGATEEITPGRMTEEEKERVERIVSDVYHKLNCKGMVRIDYFLQDLSSDFYFIEINTIPGQTAQSFIPQQVKAAGLDITEFYGQLIEMALTGNN
jgi:D-alanine-D-alanine ligase